MDETPVFIRGIELLNEYVGRTISWFALIMVLMQFTVVGMRYIFGLGSIMMQESVFYMHGSLFMVGAGYTLLHNGHVRVDAFYREASARRKALVDLVGVIAFIAPISFLIWWYGLSYVLASWSVFESSKETSGLPAVFLLKTVILVFATLVPLQGFAMATRSIYVLTGRTLPPADGQTESI